MGTSGYRGVGTPEQQAKHAAELEKQFCEKVGTSQLLSTRSIELKCDPDSFPALLENLKKVEIRFDDRGYKVGDTLVLFETKFSGEEMAMGAPLVYTGRKIVRIVTHVLHGAQYGLVRGCAALSIRPVWGSNE